MNGRYNVRLFVSTCVAFVAAACFAAGDQHANSRVKRIAFDEFAKDMLVRSIPLKVAVPATFALFVDKPAPGTWMWTTPAGAASIEKHSAIPPDVGVFRTEISLSVAYDLNEHVFFCGPGCDEAKLAEQTRQMDPSADVSKYTINGVPVLIVSAHTPDENGAKRRVHLAYIATLISTNVVMVSYVAPTQGDEKDQIWTDFESALRSSGPVATAELAAVQPDTVLRLQKADPSHGTTQNGRYVAPNGLFSVALPEFFDPSTEIEEAFNDGGFTIRLTDDFGNLRRLEGTRYSRGEKSVEVALRTFVKDTVMPLFRAASPSAAVVSDEFLPDFRGGAVVQVIKLPGAASIAEVDAERHEKRLDATRAIVAFFDGGFVVVASAQIAQLGSSEPQSSKQLVTEAMEFARSVRFAREKE